MAAFVQQALKGALDFETLETLMRKTSLRIKAEVLESMINFSNDELYTSIIPPNGTVLRYVGVLYSNVTETGVW